MRRNQAGKYRNAENRWHDSLHTRYMNTKYHDWVNIANAEGAAMLR